jgi:hypothetical protein
MIRAYINTFVTDMIKSFSRSLTTLVMFAIPEYVRVLYVPFPTARLAQRHADPEVRNRAVSPELAFLSQTGQ